MFLDVHDDDDYVPSTSSGDTSSDEDPIPRKKLRKRDIARNSGTRVTENIDVHRNGADDDNIATDHDGGHHAGTTSGSSILKSNITVMQTNNSKDKRKWDKGAYCPFCKTFQKKLPRHLQENKSHQNEIQIIQWKATREKSLKDKLLTKMRNYGNFLHNADVLEKGVGEIIPVYRPSYNADYNNYIPCKYCLGYFAKSDLWKHSCKVKEDLNLPDQKGKGKKKREEFVRPGQLLLPSPGRSEIAHEILSGLQDDVNGVARFIKSDELMHQLTEKYALKLGHDKDQFGHIRNKLREVGRMVLEYRVLTNESSAMLTDIIDPVKFNYVIQATRKAAGFNETTHLYKTPSLALKIGHKLKKVTEILLGKALMAEDEVMEKRCDRFRNLLAMKWIDVSSHALRTLTENKRNNPAFLPVTSDIAKFNAYLKTQIEEGKQNLTHCPNTSQNWKYLSEVTLAAILVFNRKRSGEVSKIKLRDLDKCKQGAENLDMFAESLSKWEKELCSVLCHLEITGKKGRTVPVLLTEAIVESLNLLKDKRQEAGVLSENEYVFPVSPEAISEDVMLFASMPVYVVQANQNTYDPPD